MGEGVSLSLPRKGFLVSHSLEGSVPFARELGLSQILSLISVSRSREHVSLCERNSSSGFKLPNTENIPKGAVMMHPSKASSSLSKKGQFCVLVEDAAFTGSGFSKKGQVSVLVEDTGTDDDQLTGKVTGVVIATAKSSVSRADDGALHLAGHDLQDVEMLI